MPRRTIRAFVYIRAFTSTMVRVLSVLLNTPWGLPILTSTLPSFMAVMIFCTPCRTLAITGITAPENCPG